MRPPICVICGRRDNCVLVYFKETKEDKEWYKLSEKGLVGHPPNAEWFCEEHYSLVENLKHLTLAEAMRIVSDKL